jgi:hypothetical protein
MKCNDFHELIDSYLCDELLTETNHGVLRHLENCENCRAMIKSRREFRQHLRSAVINAPQYQIGKNFTHRLTTQLKHEALKNGETKMASRFGYGSWIAVAAGLILTFTFGFFLLNNSVDSNQQTLAKNYIISNLPPNDLTNIALGDHEFCAVEHNKNEPVVLTQTPVKYEKIDTVVMSPIENTLDGCKLIQSHSCKYKGQIFTHLIVEKDGKHLSIMITDLKNAEKLTDEDILYLSSDKYQIARFDLKDEAVFVISDFNKEKNIQAAKSIFNPLRDHFDKDKFSPVKTSFLTFIK